MPTTNEPDDDLEGWQLEDNSAEAYERNLVPDMFTPWADRLVSGSTLRRNDRILDVGCGTGIVARRAAASTEYDVKIVGLDANPGMLAVARKAGEEWPIIDWEQGEATDLPFEDGAFDVVFCQQALQFFPDPTEALREMNRVLASDGRLAVSVWRPIEFHEVYGTFAEILERHVGADAAAMMRSPFPAWDRSDLREFARDAGFDEVKITIDIGSMRYPSPTTLVQREIESSPLAEQIRSEPTEILDALVRDVQEAIRSYTDDDGVIFPMETHVVTTRQ